ncbi:hypothetical protein [Winogradskyella sp. A3E31]|uniref:hypothetical protein n=1 Tax=Winogradskyella sp. A3E31 TaxID=3349637 RepID=UPI00398AF175
MLVTFQCNSFFKKGFYFFTLLFIFSNLISGQTDSTHGILSTYKNYTKLPREQIYVHLNKTTYIKGEALAFAAYIFDKHSKYTSKSTKNLYVTVKDYNDQVIKEQLLKVNNGFTSGLIEIDSLFSSGRYTFEAYTNWNRNFEEYNYYTQSINIIDTKVNTFIESVVDTTKIDVQFLPEGGILVEGIPSTVGVVAKDLKGYGITKIEGVVYENDNNKVATFKTNEFGHAKFMFRPKMDAKYSIQVKYLNSNYRYELRGIKKGGLSLITADLGDKIAIRLSTNNNTLPALIYKSYKLLIHNGTTAKLLEFKFNEQLTLTKIILKTSLFTGVNIITIFDDLNKPVLERMVFNEVGIDIKKISESDANINTFIDSSDITMSFKDIKSNNLNNISISVLPKNSKAYNQHNNILSSIYLQPFFKHPIEKGSDYFSNKNKLSTKNIDLLLLTEGYSSYDWHKIKTRTPKDFYDFEEGITATININNKNTSKYIVYTTGIDSSHIITLPSNISSFKKVYLFPKKDEFIEIGSFDDKNRLIKPSTAVSFQPSKIPKIYPILEPINQKKPPLIPYTIENEYIDLSAQGYITLEEIIIKGTSKRDDIRSRHNRGKIEIFDERITDEYYSIGAYLRANGYGYYRPSQGVTGQQHGITRYYINDVQFLLKDIQDMDSDLIDYVVMTNSRFVDLPYTRGLSQSRLNLSNNFYSGRSTTQNTNNLQNRAFGQNQPSWDATKVYIYLNNENYAVKQSSKIYQQLKFPITFESAKEFYRPRYPLSNSRFFEDYGVIHWVPKGKIDEQGKLKFTIPNSNLKEINIHIEGFVDGGVFISETKTISLN